MKIVVLVLAVLCAVSAQADCPFNIPVVTIPPHSINGFNWGNVVRPMNDPCIGYIAVDPSNNAAWYAAGFYGLYQTKNHGLTWTKILNGNVGALFLVKEQPHLVYASIGNRLYLTRDSGATWAPIRTFSETIASLLVSNNVLYVGPSADEHITPSGIWMCTLNCSFSAYKQFGNGATGVIVWTMSRDPITGTLYAGGEIFDHPQPYDPPFFKSTDSGNSWTDISAGLPWHAMQSAVRPNDGYLYLLLEGSGVYGSPNQGTSWLPPSNSLGLGIALQMDPQNPSRLYAGRQKFGTVNGGIFLSTNAGISFQAGGLAGATVADIALNGANSRIYAAVYGSGIYVSNTP
jgi:hypothetical protein